MVTPVRLLVGRGGELLAGTVTGSNQLRSLCWMLTMSRAGRNAADANSTAGTTAACARAGAARAARLGFALTGAPLHLIVGLLAGAAPGPDLRRVQAALAAVGAELGSPQCCAVFLGAVRRLGEDHGQKRRAAPNKLG